MKFYVLKERGIEREEAEIAGTDASKFGDVNRGPAPHCPECGGTIGMLTWLPPYRVELETWGREFGDFAFLSVGSDILVSQRFREIYDRHGLIGLSGFEPVEVVKVKRRRKSLKDDPPPYFKANVVHSQATLDVKASGEEWAPPGTSFDQIASNTWGVGELDCPVCLHRKGVFARRKGVVIEPGTWSGEDIFIPRASADFLVTPKFKDCCEQHSIKNAFFVPAEQHGVDFYPSKAKIMDRVLRRWEDEKESRSERQLAYRTLANWVEGDTEGVPTWDFDPEHDIDPSIIDEARRRIRKETG